MMIEPASDPALLRGRFGVDGDYRLIAAPVVFVGYLLLCLAAAVLAAVWLVSGRTLLGLGATVVGHIDRRRSRRPAVQPARKVRGLGAPAKRDRAARRRARARPRLGGRLLGEASGNDPTGVTLELVSTHAPLWSATTWGRVEHRVNLAGTVFRLRSEIWRLVDGARQAMAHSQQLIAKAGDGSACGRALRTGGASCHPRYHG
jgi:hypothetical protein